MNVLGILPQYIPHSRVGAWITTHEYLAGLVARDHRVDVVTVHASHPAYTVDGINVHSAGAEVASPDVVVTHLGIQPHAAYLAASFAVPVVRMVHGSHEENGPWLDTLPTGLAVFSSQALVNETGWDGPTLVAHPPVRREQYRVRPGKHVTLSNLSQDKGGALIGWIAEAHPELPFLGVLGWGFQYQQQPANVRVIDPVDDMRQVYRQTRILLMPSKTETYGRCSVEAACSGIPTIAHPSPGLVEAMGDAAVWVDRADRQGWIDTVGRLQDPDEWKAASQKARRAIQPDPDATVAGVCDAIEALAMVDA